MLYGFKRYSRGDMFSKCSRPEYWLLHGNNVFNSNNGRDSQHKLFQNSSLKLWCSSIFILLVVVLFIWTLRLVPPKWFPAIRNVMTFSIYRISSASDIVQLSIQLHQESRTIWYGPLSAWHGKAVLYLCLHFCSSVFTEMYWFFISLFEKPTFDFIESLYCMCVF